MNTKSEKEGGRQTNRQAVGDKGTNLNLRRGRVKGKERRGMGK